MDEIIVAILQTCIIYAAIGGLFHVAKLEPRRRWFMAWVSFAAVVIMTAVELLPALTGGVWILAFFCMMLLLPRSYWGQ